MSDYWFKPKVYGYGAQPANWKGWVATLAFVAFILGSAWFMIGVGAPTAGAVLTWSLIALLGTIAFILFAKSKTKGAWGWRWGRDDADLAE